MPWHPRCSSVIGRFSCLRRRLFTGPEARHDNGEQPLSRHASPLSHNLPMGCSCRLRDSRSRALCICRPHAGSRGRLLLLDRRSAAAKEQAGRAAVWIGATDLHCRAFRSAFLASLPPANPTPDGRSQPGRRHHRRPFTDARPRRSRGHRRESVLVAASARAGSLRQFRRVTRRERRPCGDRQRHRSDPGASLG
jgi:hypothetical protein